MRRAKNKFPVGELRLFICRNFHVPKIFQCKLSTVPTSRLVFRILNKKSLTTNKGWSPSFGVQRGAKNSSPKSTPGLWSDLGDSKWTWNIRAGTLNTVTRELAKYELELIRMHKVTY